MAGLSRFVQVGAALAVSFTAAPANAQPMTAARAALPAFCIAEVDVPAGEDSEAPIAGDLMLPYENGEHLWLKSPPLLTGDDVAAVGVGFSPETRRQTLRMRLTRHGRTVLASYTAAHVGERVAVILDGKVLSAPRIIEEIDSGEIEPTGNFDAEAEQIAARIRQIAHLSQPSA